VIRVSGPAAATAVQALTGREVPAPRQAALRKLRDPGSGSLLDEALVLWFPGPRSETGEDMAEFHVHGGRAVVDGVTQALARLPGLRPAEPGEFTRRAVLNGKLDLTAAEAVADLVDADTARQRDQALGQLSGSLATLYDGWRDRLVAIMARFEAVIDFAEEDLPGDVTTGLTDEMAALEGEIRTHLADERRGERLRDGLEVAIVGAPNVGKSSLLNLLARRDAAIVSEEAGTTRDVVEVTLEIDGFPVILADTAGLRDAGGVIEAEGMRRARERAARADLVIGLVDATRREETLAALRDIAPETMILVENKADLALPEGPLALSCATGDGLDRLLAALGGHFGAAWRNAGPGPTRSRHRAGLEQAAAGLARAKLAGEVALAAEDLRLAAAALGRLTGRVDVEDLLDVIFGEFCIGK